MLTSEQFTNLKIKISTVIDSLVDIVKNSNDTLDKSSYFYHSEERKIFIIYLYIYKLLINNDDYIKEKYYLYKEHIRNRADNDISEISNIEADDELDLLLRIKQKLFISKFHYDDEDGTIYLEDDSWFDSEWFIILITLIIDNISKNKSNKQINICYAIGSTELTKLENREDMEQFLSNYTYYNIKIKQVDKNKTNKDNSILTLKNAAINYLKHLKQYEHGLESSESYQIFYNLLKSECEKQGFELSENAFLLSDIQSINFEEIIDDNFCKQTLSKQNHIIENAVWKTGNDITLLEYTNGYIDNLVDLLTVLPISSNKSYKMIKEDKKYKDIQLLLILITSKFLLTYLNNEDIDYSLLELSNVKPKYMSSIYNKDEQILKNKIKGYTLDLNIFKKNLEYEKNERYSLNIEELGKERYQSQLEKCVSNINRLSIKIASLNSKLATSQREYEEIKTNQKELYKDVDNFTYNNSIIQHICNSIIGCSFYMKTNNNSSLMNNIIIFEDFERTENSFYLEISFKELLKISNPYLINSITEQEDLPKLA
ncbi:MAG: hypothetical protein ACI4WW_07065 [Candidatus Coprovivens sp.]